MLIERHDNKLKTFEITDDHNMSARLNITNANDQLMMLENIEVPQAMRGKNISSQLIEMAAEEAMNRGAKLIPMCSYIRSKLYSRPEWSALICR